jgi:SPP1 gp7 family putative phage head morphogenesis protein
LRISQGLRARWEDDVRRILIQALQTGETPRETQRKLQDLFEPWLGDRTLIRDEEEVAPHRLEAILRTNATEAFNQGRLVTARGAAPLLRGLIYSAVIDSRTTPVCRFLDRKIIRLDDPHLERLTPPRHWNCRSVLVPVPLDMEVDEEDILTPAQAARALEMSSADFR